MASDLIIGMAGSGGDGIVSAGESLVGALAADGYYALMTKSFGSQIRGGESSCRVRLSNEPVLSMGGALDVAVALNWDDFLRFGSELAVGGHTVVIYEAATGIAPDRVPLPGILPAECLSVPIAQMAKETTGSDRGKNTVVLGLLAGWFGLAEGAILAGIRRKFAKKGEEMAARNEKAFAAGVEYTRQNPLKTPRPPMPPSDGKAKLLADGNHVAAMGAIFAGCRFFAGYPITPSTEIMEALGREIWKYGGTVLQTEDEIAAMGAVVGASFAGVKSMTATSGPGMALKTEILGLAHIAELPVVVVNVQRGGPATGIPTKSEQSDLLQAAFSSHGDNVRPVLAPVSVADTFGVTVEAFNIAEEYQTPVIVLSDQEIGQRKEIFDPIDTARFRIVDRTKPQHQELEDYVRFRLTDTGISPISHPGMEGGAYLASGIEHTETGAPTAKGEIHARMNEKRISKLNPLKRRRDLFVIEGDPKAPIAMVSWGSVSGVAREALALAQADGLHVKLMIPKLLYPIADEIYRDFFSGVQRGLVIEQSHLAQLYRLLRMWTDVPAGVEPLARSGSNPITPKQVREHLRRMVRDLHTHRMGELQPQLD